MMPSTASTVSSIPAPGGTSSGAPPARVTARTYSTGSSAASSSQAPNVAGVRYVVMPTTGLATLVQPLALPARHDPIEDCLLRAGVVQIVIDDVVAERGASHCPALQSGDRLPQRRREPIGRRLVRVPLERRRKLQRLLDPMKPGGEHRREREIGVHVAPGDPRLDPQGRAGSDNAEPARAVVASPRQRRRRPRLRRVTL